MVPDNGQLFEQLKKDVLSAPSHNELLKLFREKLLEVCGVEMASIFLVDSLKMQLVSWLVLPGESLRKIRIPIDETSIAGYTASARKLVLIEDPYDEDELHSIDPELKFDSSWDRQNNNRTRQILATPIMVARSLLGVIQVMNKTDGRVFSADDQRHIHQLAGALGDALIRLQRAA